MADYTIVGSIIVEDASAPGTRSAERNLKRVEDRAAQVGTNITGALGRAFAFLGGTALLGGAASGLVGLNSEIETARGGLASLFSAMTGMSIGDSLKVARGELRGLQEDARKGVGELDNYIEGFSKILGPGLNAGVSMDVLRDLNRNALAAGAALRGDQGLWMAPMDLVQALTSGATDKTTPIVAQALSAAGMSMSEFNALDQAKKFEALNEAFLKFAPGVKLMGQTWGAQSSTFKDNIKDIIRTLTLPLFNRWTESLRAANEWIESHRATLVEIAETWGARLLRIWDHVLDNARNYLALLTAAAAIQAAPGVIGGARAIGAGAGRAAGAVGPLLRGALADPLGIGAMFGSTAAGAGGIGGLVSAAAGGIKTLAMTVGRVAGPVALVVGAFAAVQGALSEFPALLGFLAESGRFLVDSFSSLAGAFGSLTESGSALNLVGAALVATFGGIGYILGGVVRGFSALAIGLGTVLQIIGDGLRAIYYLATGNFAEAARISVSDRLSAGADQIGAALFGDNSNNNGIQGEQTNAAGMTAADLARKKGGDTNINIANAKFEMKTEANADPARVMEAWGEVADRLVSFPTQARRQPVL